MADERDSPGGTSVPPLVYAGVLLLGLALDRAFSLPSLSKEVSRGRDSASDRGSAARRMVRANDAVGGHPFRLDEPATTLVTGGPFRYSRNPGYPSFAMVQAGMTLMLDGTWGVLLVPATVAVIGRRVVEREERYLERAFGKQYLRYKANVRRWV